ncbi:MAG TPA: CbiX/SirB N-terminal domain-containing protein [Gemmatimonadaceae bacterium]|nr:CbiX/SirB N-terminal domain-containing protein [Gemmatimonadaceae bacterium]
MTHLRSLRLAAALLALGAAPLAAQGHPAAGHGSQAGQHGGQHAGTAAAQPPAAPAQRPALPPRTADAVVGTVIIAHGGGPDWNAQVEAMAAGVRTGGPVAVSYLMGPGAKTHGFQHAVRKLVDEGATDIAVVPLLVSSHSGHYEQIRYLVGEVDTLSETMMHHLHMGGITRPDVKVPLRLTRAVDESPDAARVLAERAKAIVPDAAERSRRALFLLGHGPNSAEDYASWMRNLRQVADTVRAATGFRSVLVELVRDDAPAEVRAEAVARVRELIALQHELTGKDVAVVPILVSTGQVSKEKFPKDIEGLPVIYTGDALLPHPEMARWVEARVREAGR